MKDKRGFTLVELLAIITILAILALITTPIVMNLIDDSRKNTFENSVQGVYRTIQQDYTQHGYTNSQTYTISETTITNTSDTNRTDSITTFSGKIDDGTGSATASYDSTTGALKIIIEVQNNSFCAKNTSKNGRNEYDITEGEC